METEILASTILGAFEEARSQLIEGLWSSRTERLVR